MRQRPGRSAWLAGVAVGATAGIAALEIPPVGWLLVAAFALRALIASTRVAAIGGLLVGFGFVWFTLLGRVALTCRPPDCIPDGVAPWLGLAAGILLVGSVLSVASARR